MEKTKVTKFLLSIVAMAPILAPALAACPSNWTEYSGSCYRFVNQVQLKWLDAENECSKAGDGHLVSIGTQEENQWLHNWWVSMLAPLSGRKFEYIWTGFTDRDEEGTWVWSDGTNVTFINWGGDQPDNGGGNSDCGTMVTRHARTDGKWDDAKCFAKKAYMCEYGII